MLLLDRRSANRGHQYLGVAAQGGLRVRTARRMHVPHRPTVQLACQQVHRSRQRRQGRRQGRRPRRRRSRRWRWRSSWSWWRRRWSRRWRRQGSRWRKTGHRQRQRQRRWQGQAQGDQEVRSGADPDPPLSWPSCRARWGLGVRDTRSVSTSSHIREAPSPETPGGPQASLAHTRASHARAEQGTRSHTGKPTRATKMHYKRMSLENEGNSEGVVTCGGASTAP